MLSTIGRKKESPITKTCPQCNKKFIFRSNKIYCSGYCRFKVWSLKHPRLKKEDL